MQRMMLWLGLLAAIALAGCEFKLGPSQFWHKVFKPDTDSEYYQKKTEDLVDDLARNVEEYEISKVAVMDLVDAEERVSLLGEYMANRAVEAITRKKIFRVAQRGEVVQALHELGLKPSFKYTHEELLQIGKALRAQALVNGRVQDIGANIDVHMALVDVASGEVIASATQQLNRTRFALELLRH